MKRRGRFTNDEGLRNERGGGDLNGKKESSEERSCGEHGFGLASSKGDEELEDRKRKGVEQATELRSTVEKKLGGCLAFLLYMRSSLESSSRFLSPV